MRKVHFGNDWEDSTNYAYIRNTNFIVNRRCFEDSLNYLKNNKDICYESLHFGSLIKENDIYNLFDKDGNKMFCSKSLSSSYWLEEIPDEDIDQYEYLFFE